jgi:hypothetical protein
MKEFQETKACKVYKIYSTDPQDCNIYVGSTTVDISLRLARHRFDAPNHGRRTLYRHIFDNGGWGRFDVEILDVVMVSSLQEQTKAEQLYIDKLKPTLNERKAYLTPEQLQEQIRTNKKLYYAKNRESILAKQKVYNEKHAEAISAHSKIYRANNKEALAVKAKKYCAEHKKEASVRHKAWKARNEDKVKAYKRQYYQDNIDKAREQGKVKVTCECGLLVFKSYLNKHKKTKKHLNIMSGTKPKNEKVACECGHSVVKSYLSKHMKTKKHLQAMELTA